MGKYSKLPVVNPLMTPVSPSRPWFSRTARPLPRLEDVLKDSLCLYVAFGLSWLVFFCLAKDVRRFLSCIKAFVRVTGS